MCGFSGFTNPLSEKKAESILKKMTAQQAAMMSLPEYQNLETSETHAQ